MSRFGDAPADRAASAIGRVGTNAIAVMVLARQLSKLSTIEREGFTERADRLKADKG